MPSDPWPRLQKLEVIAVATSVETPDSTYGPFLLDHYAFGWIVEGSATSLVNGTSTQSRPGTVILGRPQTVLEHRWGTGKNFHSVLVFDFHRLVDPWPEPSAWPPVRILEQDDVVFALWRYVIGRSQAGTPNDPMIGSTVEHMLRMLVTGDTGAGAMTASSFPKIVEAALSFIQQQVALHPSEPLRLDAIARNVNVSEQHLCRIFKDNVGESPMQCAQMLRLEHAGTLLDQTDLSIAEIADMFGYSSQFHFSRSFKQSYGMSPSAYRKDFREAGGTRPASLMYRHLKLRRLFHEGIPSILPQ